MSRSPPTEKPTAVGGRTLDEQGQSDRLAGINRIFGVSDSTPVAVARSTLALELLATLVMKNSRASLAVVRDEQRTLLLGSGQRLGPGIMVEQVRPTSVLLRRDRQLERLGFAQPTPGRRTKRRRGSEVSSRGIAQVGTHSFEVRRTVLESWLADPVRLARGGRVVPTASGLWVAGVRPGGIWAQLGLRSGDRIIAVNNHRITSPEVVLELYTRLRRARFVRLDLLRGGERVSVDYAIRQR